MPTYPYENNIIIIGDVSSSYFLFKRFFEIFREIIPLTKTFFVLGNHEFWDKSLIEITSNVDEIIEIIRGFLNGLNRPVTLLENQLYLPNYANGVLNEEEILGLSEEEWNKILPYNAYGIFGGVGFSGLNDRFNCNNDIYRKAPIDRTEEIKRSKRVELLHETLRK